MQSVVHKGDLRVDVLSVCRVSYIKAIDVWMFTCMVFVFGALVEYSIVNVLARSDKLRAKSRRDALETATVENTMQSVTFDNTNTDTKTGVGGKEACLSSFGHLLHKHGSSLI